MLHYVFRLIINFFELIIIEFNIKKKSFDQSLGQGHNFSVYESTFALKIGENLRALYHLFATYNFRESVLRRYNLFRNINSAILRREADPDINTRHINNRNIETTGQFVFSHNLSARNFPRRQITIRNNQRNSEENYNSPFPLRDFEPGTLYISDSE